MSAEDLDRLQKIERIVSLVNKYFVTFGFFKSSNEVESSSREFAKVFNKKYKSGITAEHYYLFVYEQLDEEGKVIGVSLNEFNKVVEERIALVLGLVGPAVEEWA